jgi:hypothetical protein
MLKRLLGNANDLIEELEAREGSHENVSDSDALQPNITFSPNDLLAGFP